MPYNPNIPAATDLLSQSQADIQGNFQALQTLIDVNHVDFASADQGKHKWCSFPVQAGSPGTLATEVAVFSRTSALTGIPELCIQYASNGVVVEMTSGLANANGWNFLPSGILLKWGTATAAGAGAQTLTYPVGAAYPAYGTAVYIVLLTPTSNITGYVTAKTTTTFTYNASAAGSFYYLAIGI